jgi:hypothetical protein
MSEQIYTYRNPSFNPNQAHNYTLLMEIDAVTFSYAITYGNQLLAWDTDCELTELSRPDKQADVLSANYKKVVIGLPANGFTLIPAPLFNAKHVANYARFLDVKPDERVLAQMLDDQNFIIYKVDEKIVTLAQKYNLDNTVYLNKGWITAIARENPRDNDVYLHAENGKAEFLAFNEGKLRFYNCFEFRSEGDLGYFTAFVANELNIHPLAVHLKISGSIQPGDKYSTLLADFFPEIAFISPQILELPEQISPQQILTLAALSLCGSSEED